MSISKQLGILTLALCVSKLAGAQKTQAPSSDLEQRIQRVTSGLIGGIVVKGEEHVTHSLADRMKELDVPGVSIAVIHNGKLEWARGFGVRSVGGLPVNAETLFQAASISKPLSTLAALRLVEQGKLSLDKDINTYLNGWKLPPDPVTAGKPVTLRELLTHTAGITVHGFPGYASTAPVPTLLQVLNGEKPANTPPIRSEAAPGARWQYSGGGFTIVQQALIDVAKEPFPKLLHDTVLAPIGMNHSTFEQPLPETLQGNAAVPYQRDGKPIEGGAYTYPELAAAGLWTTPSDLAVYVLEVEQSLLGNANHVLSVEMTRQMLIAGNGLWGLGLQIGGKDADPYFSHGGGNEGFRCLFVAYKQRGEGAVVMTNSDGGDQIADEVMHSIAMEYGWPDYQPVVRAAVKLDSAVLANYVGAFELGNGIDLVIAVENGQLISQVTGREKYPLYPESETRFFLTAYPADFEFFKDDQGKGSYLMLHQGGLDVKAPKKPATP